MGGYVMTFDPDILELTHYWSRTPGEFLNSKTGEVFLSTSSGGPKFLGSTREWYETLVETIWSIGHELTENPTHIDVWASNRILPILQMSVLFRPSFEFDGEMRPLGAKKDSVGILGKLNIFPLDEEDSDDLRILVRVGEEGDDHFGCVVVHDNILPLTRSSADS